MLFQFLFQNRLFSATIIAIIPFTIALLPFITEAIEVSIEARKKRTRIKNTYTDIKNYLQCFFKFTFITPPIPEYDLPKEEVYETFLETNFKEIDIIVIKSILLCFYCDMWEKSKSHHLYGDMQKYANSIGLSFAELTDDTMIFLKIYSAFQSKNVRYNSTFEILQFEKTESEYMNILNDFAKKYVKDISFFEIKDKLNQSENLRFTLVKIIKEGKLSKWGLTTETLEQLEKDLKKEINYSKTYLVIGNKVGQNIKDYLKSQPGLRVGRPTSQNIPQGNKYFSGAIIKPTERFNNAKMLIEKLKRLSREENETILFAIPLDFLNYERYVFPDNQSFTSRNLKACYEAISWFKTGYEYSDTDLWNAISTSSITPEELLAIVPFNIFCEGILPCEQEFMIKNYSYIKKRCEINKLSDWKNVDSKLITGYLLECGNPNYNESEKKYILNVEADDEFDAGIEKRIFNLCEQIVKNSDEFNKSLALIVN